MGRVDILNVGLSMDDQKKIKTSFVCKNHDYSKTSFHPFNEIFRKFNDFQKFYYNV